MASDPQAVQFIKRRGDMLEEQIAQRGIRDQRVLNVMAEVPRELFVPDAIRDAAYEDRALPVDCGQTISQPYIVAKMTELLQLEAQHRVLEIGTGTGYQTAILSLLANEVFTVERHAELSVNASDRLDHFEFKNIHYHYGDGTIGWMEHAPYDRILVTAGAPDVPQKLARQLADQGRLVIPVGDEKAQTLKIITRNGNKLITRSDIACRFVKLIGQQGWDVRIDDFS